MEQNNQSESLINTLGKRVAYRRHLLGLSQKELGAKLGISQQAVERIENDATKRPRKFVELATALGLEPYELLNGTTPERMQGADTAPHAPETQSTPPLTTHKTITSPLNRDLPVMGRAQGGPDGNMIINDDPIDWTFRPPELNGVHDSFAIYVTGDSMSPKYEDGDLLYIHPNRPIKSGRYAVIETADHHGLIKQFVGWQGEELVLKQYNPPKEIRLARTDIKRMMLVIGSIDS